MNCSSEFWNGLRDLHDASNRGDFSFALQGKGLSAEEGKLAGLINTVLANYRASLEYDMMKYRLTSKALNIALWDLDVVGGDPLNPMTRYTWSHEFRKLLGFSDDGDFPNTQESWSERLHPEDKERALEAMRTHLGDRTGKTPYDNAFRLQIKTGEYRLFRAFGSTQRDADGNPTRVAGAIMDITEQTETEKALKHALKENEKAVEHARTVLRKSEAMIYVTDPKDDKVMFMSDYMIQHFGLQEDVVGRKCYDVFHAGQNRKCDICPARQLDINSERAAIGEKRLESTNSHYRIVGRYIDWPNGKRVYIQYVTDLTDIKRVHAKLERREKLMKVLNEMSAVFLSLTIINFDKMMKVGIGMLADLLSIDRIGVFKLFYTPTEKRFERVYRWMGTKDDNLTLGADIKIPPNLPMTEKWLSVLSGGDVINVNTGIMTKNESDFLGAFGVKSFLLTPVFINNRLWGTVSFQDHTTDRHFDEDLVEHLRSAAFLIANAIVRNQMEHDIAEAEIRRQLMLDASPLCCQIWDDNFKVIDCNEAAIRLFKYKNKKEYLANCDINPEYQPDGSLSSKKTTDFQKIAYRNGFCTFKWMHRIPIDGTTVPSEVTFVRVQHGNSYVLVEYIRDMREHNKMIEAIEYRDSLLNAVNKAATLLHDANIEASDDSVHQSMKIIATAVGANRMHVWQNFTVGEKLYCRPLFEWTEELEPRYSEEFALGIAYRENIPGWEEILSSGKCINGIVRTLPGQIQMIFAPHNTLSILVIPVFLKNRYWGFVAFEDCRKERVFTEKEELILHSGSMLLASALRRSDMTKSLRQREEMIDALNKMAVTFLSQHDLSFNEMMTFGLSPLAEQLKLDRISVWRNHVESDGLHASQIFRWDLASGGATHPTRGLENLSFSKVVPRWEALFKANESINSPVSLLPEKNLLASFDIVSVFIAPLFINNELWGFSMFEDRCDERFFDSNSIEIMRSTAFLCTNTVILHENRKNEIEAIEKIKQREKMLASLNQMASALLAHKGDSFGDIIGNAFKPVAQIAGIDRCAVYRLSEEDGRLRQIYFWRGQSLPISDRVRIVPDELFVRRWLNTLSNGMPIFANVNELPRDEAEFLNRLGVKSIFFTPIFVHNAFWGIFALEDTTTFRSFERENLDLLHSAAHLCSSFILRSEMENEIAEQNLLTRTFFTIAPLGLFVFDNNFNVLNCNDTIPDLFGTEKRYFLNNFVDFLPEHQFDGTGTRKLLLESGLRALNGDVLKMELVFRSLEGQLIPCEITLTSVLQKDQHLGLCFVYDLRHIKKLESDIRWLETEANKIYYDPLTDIFNRRYFDINIEHVMKTMSRSSGSLTLMMIDIDYFKNYNDYYGHTQGDICLKIVANTLAKAITRADDFVARFGGEEFAVVLPNTDETGACKVAATILHNIFNSHIVHNASAVADRVTVSIGVTTGIVNHEQCAEEFIELADKMLYLSKQNGRNRFSFTALQ